MANTALRSDFEVGQIVWCDLQGEPSCLGIIKALDTNDATLQWQDSYKERTKQPIKSLKHVAVGDYVLAYYVNESQEYFNGNVYDCHVRSVVEKGKTFVIRWRDNDPNGCQVGGNLLYTPVLGYNPIADGNRYKHFRTEHSLFTQQVVSSKLTYWKLKKTDFDPVAQSQSVVKDISEQIVKMVQTQVNLRVEDNSLRPIAYVACAQAATDRLRRGVEDKTLLIKHGDYIPIYEDLRTTYTPWQGEAKTPRPKPLQATPSAAKSGKPRKTVAFIRGPDDREFAVGQNNANITNLRRLYFGVKNGTYVDVVVFGSEIVLFRGLVCERTLRDDTHRGGSQSTVGVDYVIGDPVTNELYTIRYPQHREIAHISVVMEKGSSCDPERATAIKKAFRAKYEGEKAVTGIKKLRDLISSRNLVIRDAPQGRKRAGGPAPAVAVAKKARRVEEEEESEAGEEEEEESEAGEEEEEEDEAGEEEEEESEAGDEEKKSEAGDEEKKSEAGDEEKKSEADDEEKKSEAEEEEAPMSKADKAKVAKAIKALAAKARTAKARAAKASRVPMKLNPGPGKTVGGARPERQPRGRLPRTKQNCKVLTGGPETGPRGSAELERLKLDAAPPARRTRTK